MPTPHALYRFYDAARNLLYVGITLDPGSRWKQHAHDKPWWHEVTSTTIETYPDRASVLEAERAAIIAERPRYNVVHNRGKRTAQSAEQLTTYDSSNEWVFTSRRGYERQSDLQLYWEVNCTSMSDDYLPSEIDAIDLLRMWRRKYAPGDQVPIYWSIWPMHETAPFQPSEIAWADGRNFLTYYSWPTNVATGERLNFNRLPVMDFAWNEERGDKGGFFQEATGWKPAPLQPYAPVKQILAAAGLESWR